MTAATLDPAAIAQYLLDHPQFFVEHVGLGSDVDLDGRDGAVAPKKKNDLDGLQYARKVFELTEGLIRRKYSKTDIQLILGGNFQRVLGEIWAAGVEDVVRCTECGAILIRS